MLWLEICKQIPENIEFSRNKPGSLKSALPAWLNIYKRRVSHESFDTVKQIGIFVFLQVLSYVSMLLWVVLPITAEHPYTKLKNIVDFEVLGNKGHYSFF